MRNQKWNFSGVNEICIMTKTAIAIILLVSINFKGMAQNSLTAFGADIRKFKVVDSAYMKCTYKLTFVSDTLAKNRISTDIQTLQVGKNISKCYSQKLLDYSIKIDSLRQKGAQRVPSYNDHGACSYEVFKNYPKEKYTVTDFGAGRIGKNIHEETNPDLKWEIKNEFDSVLSYRCQKAVTRFRGRTYEAWFTAEIPIGNGPWKLGGLPGIIMKVSDVQHYFNFECIGLESLKNMEPIKFFELNYAQIERKDLSKIYSRYCNEPYAFSKSMGVVDIMMVNGKESTDYKFPYNPIEIE